jgi:lipopolysaccharide export system protein LptC
MNAGLVDAPRRRLFAIQAGPRDMGAGYSRFVRGMKLLLPATAVALIMLVVGWRQLFPRLDLLGGSIRITAEDLDNLQIVQARFVGTDNEGRPYMVTADRASQTSATAKLVQLTKPKADITMHDGAWIALSADKGVFHRDSQHLSLTGDVMLFHDQGYEITSQAVDIDVKAGVAESQVSVAGQGPRGQLRAEGMRIEDRGNRILLRGKSSVTIHAGFGTAGG